MKIKDRPRDPAKWDEIADVVSALLNPVIANGDIFEYKDFKRIKDATGLHFNNTAHLLPYQLALSNILFLFIDFIYSCDFAVLKYMDPSGVLRIRVQNAKPNFPFF
jgi:hypothetical protein